MPDQQGNPRPILHLPKAKLNGSGVVKAPSGAVRHDEMVAEMHEQPEPPAPAKDS